MFWAHCCNILYHNNITVNIRFIPAFVRLVQFLPAQGHSFNSSLDIICIEKCNICMLNKKQMCYEKRPEPACRGFIRHCCGSHHQLMDGPCAGMRPGEKKLQPSNSALPSFYWFPAKHSTLQPGNHRLVTLKQKAFCIPSGQPGALCTILQGCAAGKALTVEAADLFQY